MTAVSLRCIYILRICVLRRKYHIIYFCSVPNICKGKINEQNFNTSHPWHVHVYIMLQWRVMKPFAESKALGERITPHIHVLISFKLYQWDESLETYVETIWLLKPRKLSIWYKGVSIICTFLRSIISYIEQYTWLPCSVLPWDRSRGHSCATKPISSIPLFSVILSFFKIMKTLSAYWNSCSWMTCVAAALAWWHLSKTNVIWRKLHIILQCPKCSWRRHQRTGM